MATLTSLSPDPRLDLVFERYVDLPRERIWAAWTTPELLLPWFCPKPWTTVACEIDLRPGGKFYTVMRSPEGQDHPHPGCYLEIVENERLVWTDALVDGYRPSPSPFVTIVLTLKPEANGTRYRAVALHGNEETRQKHEAMGFVEGWGKALDQLVALVKSAP